MRNTYSLYQAKARLSEIVRMVREGNTVVVTLRGEPVVEMRPVSDHGTDLKGRMNELADRGVLVRPESTRNRARSVTRKPGALKRFLAERD